MTLEHTQAQWDNYARSKKLMDVTEYLTRCLEPGQDKELEKKLPWLGQNGGFWYVVTVKGAVVAYVSVFRVPPAQALLAEPYVVWWADPNLKPLLSSLALTRCKALSWSVV